MYRVRNVMINILQYFYYCKVNGFYVMGKDNINYFIKWL